MADLAKALNSSLALARVHNLIWRWMREGQEEVCALLLTEEGRLELLAREGLATEIVFSFQKGFLSLVSGFLEPAPACLAVSLRWLPFPGGGARPSLKLGALDYAPILVAGDLKGVIGAGGTSLAMGDGDRLTALAREMAGALADQALHDSLRGADLKAVKALMAAMEAKDPYLPRHSRAVSHHAVRIAKQLALPSSFNEAMAIAGILHDVGKIGSKDEVIFKPGKLSPAEMEAIREHPIDGIRILELLELPWEIAHPVAHHHERYDGEGYPSRLKGKAIPLGARVLAVADVFAALTADRPYRRAFDLGQALSLIREGSGTQFDPEVVEAFLGLQEPHLVSPRVLN